MAKTDLRRVEAVTESGISGVRIVGERSALFPTTCALKDAAILHPGEAYALRRWARAHGINARTTLYRKGKTAKSGKLCELLDELL